MNDVNHFLVPFPKVQQVKPVTPSMFPADLCNAPVSAIVKYNLRHCL